MYVLYACMCRMCHSRTTKIMAVLASEDQSVGNPMPEPLTLHEGYDPIDNVASFSLLEVLCQQTVIQMTKLSPISTKL